MQLGLTNLVHECIYVISDWYMHMNVHNLCFFQAKIVKKDETQVTYRTIEPPREVHVKMLQANISTLENMFNYVAKTHSTKRCLGTRQILSEEDEVQPNGRIFKKYNMGDYKWKNFIEVERLAASFGRGLREYGQTPGTNIVIFAETRAEWMIAAHGCFKQNMRIVTVYATLGDEGVAHCINETEVTAVITTHDLLPKFKSLLDKTPNIKTIIYMDDQLRKTETSGFKEDITLIPFSQVIRVGTDSKFEGVPPAASDIAIIMYTSGSTGTPKGVLLSHNNLIATMKGFCDVVPIYPDDVLLGFLPLAHVFELLAESVCLLTGVPIGYSTPLTLIDTSSKIRKGCKGDATVLKPTCMTTVPLILDRITKGINDKVNAGSPFQKALFNFCYNYKVKWAAQGFQTPVIDRLVFKKVAKLMGGRVRIMMSGGAPLAPDTHEQIKICLCVDLVQGYGLTETTSGATVMDYRDMSYGRVGAPLTMCDIRLVNWEEGNYRVTNKPYPQGEIIIGGDSVSLGYYKLPSKTKEDFFEEDGKRWFQTGDIGEMHADGVLKIIDRKKDLVKLQAGEYVSLGKVESELKTCPIVENICVYGDPSKQYTVALIVPNQKHIEELAAKYGLVSRSFEELCTSPVLEKAVIKEIAEHGKKCKLQRFEIPAAITLCKEVWSPDMGLVTAAFKLKRKDIQSKFQTNCNMRTNELEAIISNLRQNNMRLKHMVSHRRNKRAIETIGNFFHWAFGTMDKEDSDKIYDHLSNLDTNENEALNLIKKQITVANSNFDRLSKPIKTLTEEVDKIGKNFENFTTDIENFATAAIKELAATKWKVEINEMISLVTSKLLEVQSRQTTELSIFNDLYQNKLHPFILDANNLSSVLKNSKYERMVLNPAALFQVVQLLSYPQRDSIVLKITVPLPEAAMFSLFKVYPVRTKLDRHWDLVLDVKTEYIAEAEDHALFVTMSRPELMQCSEVPFNSSITIKVCEHRKPIHTSGSSECLVELLQHSATSQMNCNYVASPTTKGVITKMSTKNQWLFNMRESIALNFNCDGELYTPVLKGFGVLHILRPCEINTKELRIPYEQVWSSKLKIHQPRVNHSDLIELLRKGYANLTVKTFPKPPSLSLGSHSDMIASLKEGKKSLEDLQEEANQIENRKRVNSQRLEVDVHRYSLVSISVLIIALVLCKWYLSRSSFTSTANIPSQITTNITNVVPEKSDAVKIDAVEMDALPDRLAATRKSTRGVTFARV